MKVLPWVGVLTSMSCEGHSDRGLRRDERDAVPRIWFYKRYHREWCRLVFERLAAISRSSACGDSRQGTGRTGWDASGTRPRFLPPPAKRRDISSSRSRRSRGGSLTRNFVVSFVRQKHGRPHWKIWPSASTAASPTFRPAQVDFPVRSIVVASKIGLGEGWPLRPSE